MRKIGVLAVLLGWALATTGCSSGDDGAGTTTSATAGTTVVGADTTVVGADTTGAEGAATSPDLGPTEVGLITRLPALAPSWTSHRLELPGTGAREVFVAKVAVVAGGFVAVAFGWRPAPGGQVIHTWESEDGTAWTASTLEIPAGQTVQRVVDAGPHLIAIGDRGTRQSYAPTIRLWRGDGQWELLDLADSGVDLEGVEITGAAATDAGIVLGGRRDRYEPGLDISRFEVDGFEFEIDDFSGTYAVVESESGRLVATGPLDEIYVHGEEGQAIYDLETRTLLTVVPWDVWYGPEVATSPLPIPIPPGPEEPEAPTIEWDGFEITVDEGQDRFTVVDQDSGQVVTSGTLADLYRGPAPAFFDRDTGELLIELSWDDWWELVSGGFGDIGDHEAHAAEQVVLFSPDGTAWSEQVLDTGANTHLDTVLSVDDRFAVTIVEHRESGPVRQVHLSDDGIDWTPAEGTGPEWLYEARSGPSGAVALSDVQGNSAVVASGDGLDWTTELFLPPQTDGRHGWLRQVATGALGHAAVGTLDPGAMPEVLTISVGSRTARIGGSDLALEISDDATGDILLQLDWGEMERALEEGRTAYATYADGATRFWAEDGSLLMTITDGEARAALDEQAERARAGIHHALFIGREGQWYEAALPELGGAVPEQLAVGDDVVLVGANTYPGGPAGEGELSEPQVLVGRLPE